MNFVQPLYAKAQQASKIYTRSTLICKVSVLFRFDYKSYHKFNNSGSYLKLGQLLLMLAFRLAL